MVVFLQLVNQTYPLIRNLSDGVDNVNRSLTQVESVLENFRFLAWANRVVQRVEFERLFCAQFLHERKAYLNESHKSF